MRSLLIGLIRLYQVTAGPWFRGACRHHPSCSEYAIEAIERHGLRGVGLAFRRVMRCRPFGTRGFDPVPR